MRVIVDRDLCEGHAQCVKTAPDVFRLIEIGEDDYAEVLVDDLSPDRVEKVTLAIKRCPRSALRMEP
jgi:ferredoxin